MSGRVAPEELQRLTRATLERYGSAQVVKMTSVTAATLLRVTLGETVSAGTIALLQQGLGRDAQRTAQLERQFAPNIEAFNRIGSLDDPRLEAIIAASKLATDSPLPIEPAWTAQPAARVTDPVAATGKFCTFVESLVRRQHAQKPTPWGVRPNGWCVDGESGIEIWVGSEEERVTHEAAVTLDLLANPNDWKLDPNTERLAAFVCREIIRVRGGDSDAPPPKLREQREYEDPATQLARAKALAAEQIEALQHAEPASTLVAQPVDSDRGAPGNSDGGGTRRVNEPSADPEPDHEPEHANRRAGDEPQAPRNSSTRKRRR